MCGIVGFYGYKNNIVYDIVYGLNALQHRGQDAAGIVTFNSTFNIKKGLGLVNNVFKEKNINRLVGNMGLGHVRYTTQGSNELINAQPMAVNYPFGIAMVHNGNVVNFKEVKRKLNEEHHRLIETNNDLELILYSLSAELENKDLKNLKVSDIFDSVEPIQQNVIGAYASISIIANKGMLVFMDPYNIRPLVMGKRDTDDGPIYGFASETTCFDYLGFDTIKDIEAGEIIFIDKDRQIHSRQGFKKRESFCVFCYIYFSREDSISHGNLVASERVDMGKKLARKVIESGVQPDIIIDVPSSAYFFASAMAEELGIPYRRGFSKNHHVGRSFISPTQEKREQVVRQKLNPIKEVINGKKVAVVDDSIVRGTTSKHIIKLLRKAGAKEVYFISAAPPIKHPCIYGIDIAITHELIAGKKDIKEIEQDIGADALIYQSLEDLENLYKGSGICDACFSGKYPTGNHSEYIKEMEQERLYSKKEGLTIK
jgi:amidophosphoribosyltransferase